jgi:hypothetical protein
MSKKETKTAEAKVDADVVVEDAGTTAVEKKQEGAIVPGSPEELQAYGVPEDGVAPGTESIERGDVKIPRLKIIQPMSKEANLEGDAAIETPRDVSGPRALLPVGTRVERKGSRPELARR